MDSARAESSTAQMICRPSLYQLSQDLSQMHCPEVVNMLHRIVEQQCLPPSERHREWTLSLLTNERRLVPNPISCVTICDG